jgi:hypothetical protein
MARWLAALTMALSLAAFGGSAFADSSCGSDSDCGGYGRCSGGKCGSCGSDSDCKVGKCSSGKCGSCGSDSDCKGGRCSSGRCSNALSSGLGFVLGDTDDCSSAADVLRLRAPAPQSCALAANPSPAGPEVAVRASSGFESWIARAARAAPHH